MAEMAIGALIRARCKTIDVFFLNRAGFFSSHCDTYRYGPLDEPLAF